MEEKVRKEVLEILKGSYEAVQRDDAKKLRELSNQIIHAAAVYQDSGVIGLSVVVYGLSKSYERGDYKGFKDWARFHENVLSCLREGYEYLVNGGEEGYELALKKLVAGIDKLGSKLKVYIKEVMEKAHINKGSRMYEHGVSVGRTAKLLGISQWELMEYIGGTGIADVEESVTLDVGQRLRYARGLFR